MKINNLFYLVGVIVLFNTSSKMVPGVVRSRLGKKLITALLMSRLFVRWNIDWPRILRLRQCFFEKREQYQVNFKEIGIFLFGQF